MFLLVEELRGCYVNAFAPWLTSNTLGFMSENLVFGNTNVRTPFTKGASLSPSPIATYYALIAGRVAHVCALDRKAMGGLGMKQKLLEVT